MDNQKLFLFLLFFFSTFFLFQAWQKEKQVLLTPSPALTMASPPPVPEGVNVPVPTQPQSIPAGLSVAKGETVHVETDFFIAEIDTDGGTLSRLELRKHRDTLDKNKNFLLFERQPQHIYVAQSGLLGAGLPDHHAHYVAAALDYKLEAGADRVTVRLTAANTGALQIVKTYTFHRASYVIDVGYEVENKGTT